MAKKGRIIIPMSQEVEGSGGRVRLPEGDYKVKIKSVKHETSSSGNPMLVWEYTISEGKGKGKVLRDYTPLTPKALWKLRSILEALNMTVPKKDFGLNPSSVIGKELGVTLQDDEYEGKISSKIDDYIDLETLSSVDGEDDEDEDDDDDDSDSEDSDDDDDEEDLEDVDLDEL